jgi:hypothetical protein
VAHPPRPPVSRLVSHRPLAARAWPVVFLALSGGCAEGDLGARVPACGAWLTSLAACASKASPEVRADLDRLGAAVRASAKGHAPLPRDALQAACEAALMRLDANRDTLCPAPAPR